ncbi:hypothetical protein CPAR01_12882 [Colletotrichum paranaense]|uniref:Uncharacterized protein n=1 Tax=Colletotrichum paranaense TaxID=1914294 RepID=A0ABQ9S911_9PEZI|nr:uncharacterized protein CPAR01_12882 [Colletotrichum paranaense]KAK1528324.1 hypothetical protein CPAR01_12882 [Colletotrichum paranaense]
MHCVHWAVGRLNGRGRAAAGTVQRTTRPLSLFLFPHLLRFFPPHTPTKVGPRYHQRSGVSTSARRQQDKWIIEASVEHLVEGQTSSCGYVPSSVGLPATDDPNESPAAHTVMWQSARDIAQGPKDPPLSLGTYTWEVLLHTAAGGCSPPAVEATTLLTFHLSHRAHRNCPPHTPEQGRQHLGPGADVYADLSRGLSPHIVTRHSLPLPLLHPSIIRQWPNHEQAMMEAPDLFIDPCLFSFHSSTSRLLASVIQQLPGAILRLPADGLLLLRRRQIKIKLPAAAVGAKRLLDQLSTGTIRSTPSIRTAKAWDLLWYPTLHQHCMKWTGLLRDHASSAPGPDPGTNVSLKSLVSGSLLPGCGTNRIPLALSPHVPVRHLDSQPGQPVSHPVIRSTVIPSARSLAFGSATTVTAPVRIHGQGSSQQCNGHLFRLPTVSMPANRAGHLMSRAMELRTAILVAQSALYATDTGWMLARCAERPEPDGPGLRVPGFARAWEGRGPFQQTAADTTSKEKQHGGVGTLPLSSTFAVTQFLLTHPIHARCSTPTNAEAPLEGRIRWPVGQPSSVALGLQPLDQPSSLTSCAITNQSPADFQTLP